ncbi:MAG: 50S ribosomal protein L3 [Acidobacteria bacterium]|nr:50S ribosomal protein L3 [Acidobacteriota bacterium]
MKGLIGQKVGMTRIFDESGNHVPVTVLRAGPCVVLQVRDEERDGYSAVQLGYIEDGVRPESVNKPMAGHLAKAGAPAVRMIREFPMGGEDEPQLGDRVTVESFEGVDKVDVTGTTKGRGFQGVMKRHGFKGGGAAHGSMFHRAPGSVGQASWPSRTFKGKRLPGQMGNKRDTQQALRVVKVDLERHLILVKGSVPGAPNSYVTIRPAVRG